MSTITVTYNAPEGDSPYVETHGVKFFDGHPVELDAADYAAFLRKARGNRHFKVEGENDDEDDAIATDGSPIAPVEPVKRRGRPKKVPHPEHDGE